jgi:phage shock protein PspC (stress-responsive transcriptional regulator)
MTVYRSQNNRVLAGVCGGLAEHLGWSPTRLRVVWVVGTLFSAAFPGIFLYLALWYLTPKAPLPPPAFESPPLQPWKKTV